MSANILSIPMLIPTHGTLAGAFFPSAAAAALNIPTSPSYRPPAAIDPTPTCDSSISSSSSAVADAVSFFGVFFGGAGTVVVVVGSEEEANALAALNPGGADASTMAS